MTNERMSEDQIFQAGIDIKYNRDGRGDAGRLARTLEQALSIITQLRDRAEKAEAENARLREALENLLDCHRIEWGASHPTTLHAQAALNPKEVSDERGK